MSKNSFGITKTEFKELLHKNGYEYKPKLYDIFCKFCKKKQQKGGQATPLPEEFYKQMAGCNIRDEIPQEYKKIDH